MNTLMARRRNRETAGGLPLVLVMTFPFGPLNQCVQGIGSFFRNSVTVPRFSSTLMLTSVNGFPSNRFTNLRW